MEIGISNFRVVHASGGDWRDLTEACMNQLGDTQSGENIGFVYVTDALDKNVRAIVDLLRGQTGISQWVGTVGFGICVSGIELFDTPSIAIMLGRLPPDSFRVCHRLDRIKMSSLTRLSRGQKIITPHLVLFMLIPDPLALMKR